MARREMGKLVFLDLVDRSGRIQLMCDTGPDRRRRRPPRRRRRRLGTAGEVAARRAVARRRRADGAREEPSPLPDTFHGLTDAETRYRKRYLDLLDERGRRASSSSCARRSSPRSAATSTSEGFVEVETPVLQPRYGGAFAHPFVTHSNELDSDLYLRIATELYLKRLIVGGLERVYEIGKDFRNESVSYKHQPEFTMLEWYEAYADYRDTMDRIEELLERVALDALGTTVATFRGHEIDLKRRGSASASSSRSRRTSCGRATRSSSAPGSPSAVSTRRRTRTGRSSSTTRSATSSSRA